MPSVRYRLSQGRVRRSVEGLKGRAEEHLRDQESMKRLLDSAWRKAGVQAGEKGPLAEVWSYLTGLLRLVLAYSRGGEYRDIPWRSIVLAVATIIYFVSPIDIIPDFIPGGGFVDDAAVVAFVIRQIIADVERFLAWEVEQGRRRPGEDYL